MKIKIQDTKHKAGELAYYDTFSGTIPCKVISVYPDKYGCTRITIKITADRKSYHKGEIIKNIFAHDIVPRKSLIVRSGQYRILNNYTWVIS